MPERALQRAKKAIERVMGSSLASGIWKIVGEALEGRQENESAKNEEKER